MWATVSLPDGMASVYSCGRPARAIQRPMVSAKLHQSNWSYHLRFPGFLRRSTMASAASPVAKRAHEVSMTEAEIIDATYWAGFWSRLEHWAFAGVIITLAVEFLALKFAEPHKERLEQQREFGIAELTKEGQRLSKEAETARAAIAEANAR